MSDHFTGSFEVIKAKLAAIKGEWKDLSDTQKQFRTQNGGILNWYPATGTLQFQGKSQAAQALRDAVTKAMAEAAPTIVPDAEAASARLGVSDASFSDGADDSKRKAAVGGPDGDLNEDLIGVPPSGDLIVPGGPANDDEDAGPAGLLQTPFSNSELVFALIGAVGTELEKVRSILEDRLKVVGYSVTPVRITRDVIPKIVGAAGTQDANEFERISRLMDAGNDARAKAKDNSILALGAAAYINSKRAGAQSVPQHEPKRAYIIGSLKHPDEVARLREIYPEGFYLIGVHADVKRRLDYLTQDKRIPEGDANKLMARDEDEHLPFGQKVAETFHLSDFFVRIDGHEDHLKHSLWRLLDLLFGHPYVTPEFDEYAMFMAFAASLKSADLSRQVGAVVALENRVVATGANDCPKAGGGQYWPVANTPLADVSPKEDGRDFKLGYDSNRAEQEKIIKEIVSKAAAAGLDGAKVEDALKASRIGDLTEFGRMVHAEMEALLSCARGQIRTKGGTLYSTTFPCHNCAKHIVAAGISRVVFIEPYPKSKAAEFHADSIRVGFTDSGAGPEARPIVSFEPFVGVGPRRFFDLFSVRLGSGYPLRRKGASGQALDWKPEQARLRLQMLPVSYLDLELVASDMFHKACDANKESGHGR